MFEFEKLDVYQLALSFHREIDVLLKNIPKSEYVIIDQLKRASLSVPLNIAEACGRWNKGEKRQHFFISRGSVFECIPILTILEEKTFLVQDKHAELRETMFRLIQMLTKLAKINSRDRDS